MGAPARLVVGRLLRAHGVHGELLVEPLTDAPGERFQPGAELAAGDPDQPGTLRPLRLDAARSHRGRLLVRFAGVDDRDAAAGLAGRLLSIPLAAARPLGPGEYWPHELIGLTVVERGGRERGTVEDVLPGAAHDLLAVSRRGHPGPPVLIPAVAALVTVDLDAGRVVVEPLPGLLDPEDQDQPEGSGEPAPGSPENREG